MIDLTPLKKAIAEVEAEMKEPIPTPPVGTALVWYRQARQDGGQNAAICTGIDGPGKIKLSVFPPNGMKENKQGVLNCKDPIHEKLTNRVSKENGAWDYPDGTGPSKGHYKVHIDRLQHKKDGFLTQLEDAKKRNDIEAKPQSV